MSLFEIISFDLFFTLIYLDESAHSTEKMLPKIWDLLQKNAYDVPFDVFRKEIFAKKEQRFLPPYKEQSYYQTILDIVQEHGFEYSQKLEETANEMMKEYYNSVTKACYLHPDAIEILAQLKARGSVVVLTSDHEWPSHGQYLLEKYGLEKYFDKVTFSGDVGYRKPSSDMFEKTIEGFELSQKDKLVHIGDSFETDIQGVINFGGQAIWIDEQLAENKTEVDLNNCDQTKIIAIIPSISHLHKVLEK